MRVVVLTMESSTASMGFKLTICSFSALVRPKGVSLDTLGSLQARRLTVAVRHWMAWYAAR